VLTILAFICFAIATVWFAITRVFPLALWLRLVWRC